MHEARLEPVRWVLKLRVGDARDHLAVHNTLADTSIVCGHCMESARQGGPGARALADRWVQPARWPCAMWDAVEPLCEGGRWTGVVAVLGDRGKVGGDLAAGRINRNHRKRMAYANSYFPMRPIAPRRRPLHESPETRPDVEVQPDTLLVGGAGRSSSSSKHACSGGAGGKIQAVRWPDRGCSGLRGSGSALCATTPLVINWHPCQGQGFLVGVLVRWLAGFLRCSELEGNGSPSLPSSSSLETLKGQKAAVSGLAAGCLSADRRPNQHATCAAAALSASLDRLGGCL